MDDSTKLQKSLDALAKLEVQMGLAERDCEVYRIKKTSGIYKSRSSIVSQIDKFWYIVLAENDEFADYIALEDLKYLESIENISVQYKIADIENPTEEDLEHFKDFDVTFTFAEGPVAAQSVTKKFRVIIEEGEEKIISEPVEVSWPKDLEDINPRAIKDRVAKSNAPMTKEDKKKYRLGMKSFFSWFAWTGEKPGKEFRNGEELTRLIVDDLFLNAIKYYVVALQNEDEDESEDEEDSSEGEALDLSDGEPERKKRKAE